MNRDIPSWFWVLAAILVVLAILWLIVCRRTPRSPAPAATAAHRAVAVSSSPAASASSRLVLTSAAVIAACSCVLARPR